jgi:penicillin amidase
VKKRGWLILAGSIGLLLLAGLAAGLAWYYYNRDLTGERTLYLPVETDVVIERDREGVPAITATSLHDYYMALGYLHARDRREIIRYWRYLALSRAERVLAGHDAGIMNRLSASLGFQKKGTEMVSALDGDKLSWLKAYCLGVNQGLAREGTELSPEESWQPADLAAILLMRDWFNAYLYNRESIFMIPDDDRAGLFSSLFPERVTRYYKEEDRENIEAIRRLTSLVRRVAGPFLEGYAAWVPASRMEKDHHALVYGYTSSTDEYPGYYPVIARIGERRFRGLTFNGLPFMVNGMNGSLQFAFFPLKMDSLDLVREEVRTLEGTTQYLAPAGWKNFVIKRVPDPGSAMVEANRLILSTENGPVVQDILGGESFRDSVVSLRYSFPGKEYLSRLLGLPLVTSMEEAEENFTGVDTSPLVFLFADDETAYRIWSGKLNLRPRNREVLYDGELYRQGRPIDLSLYSRRYAEGIVVAGELNTDLPPEVQAYFLPRGHRYERLTGIIREMPVLNESQLMDLIGDSYSLHAERYVSLLIRLLKMNPVTSARLTRIYFHDWDFRMDEKSVAATLFHTISYTMLERTLSDDLPGSLEAILYHRNYLMEPYLELLEQNTSALFDIRDTEPFEGRDKIFDLAFLQTLRELNRKAGPIMDDWKWGRINRTRFAVNGASEDIIADFFYSVKKTELKGGTGTLYELNAFNEGKPGLVQALCGYRGRDFDVIYPLYAVSIHPRSPFFYGKKKSYRPVPVRNQPVFSSITIRPGNKKPAN